MREPGIIFGLLTILGAFGLIIAGDPSASDGVRISGAVKDIQWLRDSQNFFLLSENSILYKSNDGGQTMYNQLDSMENAQVPQDTLTGVKTGVSAIHICAKNPQKVFFQGHGKYHWTTSNGADSSPTYTLVQPRENNQDLVFNGQFELHPTECDWILAAVDDDMCRWDDTMCHKNVYLTKDFGRTWTKLSGFASNFKWAPAGHSPKETIFMTRYDESRYQMMMETGHSMEMYTDFVRSDDFFKSSRIVIHNGFAFAVEGSHLFVGKVNVQYPDDITLYVSTNRGDSFHPSEFPYRLMENGYVVLDHTEGQAFVAVRHGCGADEEYANVYSSDGNMYRFALSLRKMIEGDFIKIEGVDGVYIANVEKEGMSFGTDKQISTKITFDKGGKWHDIRSNASPKFNIFQRDPLTGREKQCVSCQLQLQGLAERIYAPIYSSLNATGLILASGNIGPSLSYRADEVSLWFSPNAGLSWYEVEKGSWIYEYGDHGAIMVIADNTNPSNTIKYSWDQGVSWTEFKFSEEKIKIRNVIVEPSATSQEFLIYGTSLLDSSQGMVFRLDFSAMHERQCAGQDAARPCAGIEEGGSDSTGEDDSDYCLFSPSDHLDGKCLLGKQVQYVRRKRTAQCFNGVDHEKSTFVKTCPCEEEDWTCDFDFERPYSGGSCTNITRIDTRPPLDCSGSYYVTQGYRRVPGDECDAKASGAVNYEPLQYKCPAASGSGISGAGLAVLLLMIFAILGVAGLAYARYKHDPDVFNDLFGKLSSLASGTKRGYSRVATDDEESAFGLNDMNDGLDDDCLGDDAKEPDVLRDNDIRRSLGGTRNPRSSRYDDDIDLNDADLPPMNATSKRGSGGSRGGSGYQRVDSHHGHGHSHANGHHHHHDDDPVGSLEDEFDPRSYQ